MSTRFFELALGGLWVGFGVWAVAFDWFSTYLTELGRFAGHEWALLLIFAGYGSLQIWAAAKRLNALRVVCAMLGALSFLSLAIFMIDARSLAGAHAIAFPYMSAVHLGIMLHLIAGGRRAY